MVYSSREGTAASFTVVVRERPLGLQQPIDFQLSMVVIVLYLIRTGSNLYSRGGGLFLFLHAKVRFAIAKPLLATEREQRKPASTSKDTNSTKKQQIDREIQAFTGHFRIKTGRVQSLQIPALYLFLYSKHLTLYCKCLILTLHNN